MSITPLGRPVVPPVPTIIARSSTPLLGDRVGRRPVDRPVASRKCVPGQRALDRRRRGRPAVVELGQVGAIASTSGANDAWKISAVAVEEVEQLAVLGRLVARVDRAPHRAGAADAEHAGEATGSLADRIATLPPGRDAAARQGRGDPARGRLHLGVATATAPSVVRQGASGPSEAPLSR